MKRIFYASGSVLTGDSMAEAVVRYAEALAMRDTSDTIDIPIALDSGGLGRAQLLIGPASQLVVVPEEGGGPAQVGHEPEDEETLKELARRASLLSSPHPLASDDGDNTDYVDDSGYAGASDTGTA